MVKKNFLTKVFSLFIASSFCFSLAFAQEIGKITYVEGRVDTFKAGSDEDEGVPAIEYENIALGDAIRTKSNSKVEIKFKDDSIVRLAQNSKIEIKDYQLDEKGKRKAAAIKLERGKLRAIVAKSPQGTPFAILTSNAEGVVKGSDVFVFYQAGSSGMLVAEGKLNVTSTAHPESPVLITAGNSVLVPLEKLPEGPRPYLDLEKKLYEQDTDVPFSGHKAAKLTEISATIAKFSGVVLITNKGQTKTHNTKLGEVVKEGDLIETLEKALVEIRLDNNNAINMKPNSKLLVIKLAFNPETGEYENIFELTIGKIKARIEGLKGKSKFEIKTPLAICGARGTILYVNTLPNLVESFVEGGNGYITSILSGDTQEIPGGQSSSADNQGGVSPPVTPDQEQRQSFSEGFDPGSGVEGYSAPEGGAGSYLYDADTGINTTAEEGAGNTDNTTQDILTGGASTDIPFTESNPQTNTTGPYSLSGNFSGNFAYYDSWEGPGNDYLHLTDNITNGALSGTGALWSGSQSVALSGNFTLDSLDYHDEDLWVVDSDDFGTTTDGARFLGSAGGIKIGNSLKGVFYALYIRLVGSGYQSGYLSSTNLSGNIDSGLSGGLSLSGTLGYHDMASTALSPQDIYRNSPYIKEGNEQGKVGGSASFLSGNIKVDTFDLKAPNSDNSDSGWGIWRVNGGGSYTTAPIAAWSADIGGFSVNQTAGSERSYWLGDLSGDAWGSRDFSSNMSGTVLSDDWLEEFNGTGYGIHYPHELSPTGYSWEFLAAGEDHRTLNLSSSGRFVAQGWNIGEGSPFDFAGLIGLTGPIWGAEDQPDFISIGEFTPPDSSNPDKQFAWEVKKEWLTSEGVKTDGFVSRYISQSFPLTYNYSTYDDGSGGAGSFYGLSAGVGGNGKLLGKIYSLYIAPFTGDAGVLYGDVNGNYYDGIGMYRLDGELTKNLHTQIGILPQDLHSNISWDTLSGLVDGGSFVDDGTATGDILANGGEGTMLNITGQNWGVWNLVTGGTYSGRPSGAADWQVYDLTGMTSPSDANYIGGSWLGGMLMSDPFFGEDRLSGDINAIWIGLGKNGTLSGRAISGEVVGNYIEVPEDSGNGNWQAASAGEWVEASALLDTTNPANLTNFTNNLITTDQFVSIPITEMAGSNSFITSATMNLNLYAMAGGGDGIWAAIINGSYSVDPTNPNNWVLNLSNLSEDSAMLNGTSWIDGHWQGTMTINTSQGSSPADQPGQAAGTYTPGAEGGTFTGAGTGTYQ